MRGVRGSWRYYETGNAQAHRGNYRPQIIESNTRAQIKVCTREFFAARRGWGVPAPDPILIVGLPRSGTDAARAGPCLALTGGGRRAAQRAPRSWRACAGATRRRSGRRYPRSSPSLRPMRCARSASATWRARALPPRQAVLHRQDAEQLPPGADPPDAAQAKSSTRREPALLFQRPQAAVRPRPRVPTASRTSLYAPWS